MTLLIALTIASVAGYLKITLAEEIEVVFAGLVALGLFLSLFFAPIPIELVLPAILLFFPKANLV